MRPRSSRKEMHRESVTWQTFHCAVLQGVNSSAHSHRHPARRCIGSHPHGQPLVVLPSEVRPRSSQKEMHREPLSRSASQCFAMQGHLQGHPIKKCSKSSGHGQPLNELPTEVRVYMIGQGPTLPAVENCRLAWQRLQACTTDCQEALDKTETPSQSAAKGGTTKDAPHAGEKQCSTFFGLSLKGKKDRQIQGMIERIFHSMEALTKALEDMQNARREVPKGIESICNSTTGDTRFNSDDIEEAILNARVLLKNCRERTQAYTNELIRQGRTLDTNISRWYKEDGFRIPAQENRRQTDIPATLQSEDTILQTRAAQQQMAQIQNQQDRITAAVLTMAIGNTNQDNILHVLQGIEPPPQLPAPSQRPPEDSCPQASHQK